jgi:hypothetical protein
MHILAQDKVNHGYKKVAIYHRPEDLWDDWKIISVDTTSMEIDQENLINIFQGEVIETFTRWDDEGWTKQRTEIYVDGSFVAGSGDPMPVQLEC